MEPARRWAKLDRWITTIISGYVDENQKGHINHKETSKARWDALKRVHGVSGKGRLPAMLQRFNGYTKSADQTIDQVVSDLRKLRNDISDLNPTSAPDDMVLATTLMSACKESEFDMAKAILSQNDQLNTELAVEQLRAVESTKDTANFARRGGRRTKDREERRPQERDLSQVKCYRCDQKGYLARDCPEEGQERKDGDTN